jgi:hypothetical protein
MNDDSNDEGILHTVWPEGFARNTDWPGGLLALAILHNGGNVACMRDGRQRGGGGDMATLLVRLANLYEEDGFSVVGPVSYLGNTSTCTVVFVRDDGDSTGAPAVAIALTEASHPISKSIGRWLRRQLAAMRKANT